MLLPDVCGAVELGYEYGGEGVGKVWNITIFECATACCNTVGCSFYNYVSLDTQYTNMNSKPSICYLKSTITSRKQTFMMYAGSINGALPAPVPGPPVVTKPVPGAPSGKALCQPYSINWYFTGVEMKDVFMDWRTWSLL